MTPSLLERYEGRPNYVMEHEYPAAVDAFRPILPAEMLATNPEQLKKDYPGIPDCIDGSDEAAVLESMVQTLKEIALKPRDPDHNYLIGLAYLDGIDVEVNSQRAVELITDAAKKGQIEAMRKLSVMYRSGKGLERDYAESASWQETLIGALKDTYQKAPTEENRQALCSALRDLGNDCFDLYFLKKAGKIFDEIIRINRNADTPASRHDLASCYCMYGKINTLTGRSYHVRGYLEDALEIFRSLDKENSTADSRRDVAQTLSMLGEAQKKEGDMGAARESCKQALELSRELADESRSIESRRDLALCCDRLGDIEAGERNLESARNYYKQAMEIRKKLAEETNSVEARRDLSVSWHKLGDVERKGRHFENAKAFYLQALELRKRLADETGTMQSRGDVSTTYYILALLIERTEGMAAAKQYYDLSKEIDRPLKEESSELVRKIDPDSINEDSDCIV